MERTQTESRELAEALAFVGNSFLRPPSQTADVGLDPGFWAAFPDFGDEALARALKACASWARAGEGAPREERVRAVSVEYARLFIGPPEPAVAPWETFHVSEGVTCGFGEPTFRMQERLRGLGLAVAGESNQYADHIGIELLYLSELVRRGAQDEALAAQASAFAAEVLEPWALRFRADLAAEGAGYYGLMADVALALVAIAGRRPARSRR